MGEVETSNPLMSQLRFDGIILAGIFVIIYLLRFLDGIFLKDRLKNSYGMQPRQQFSPFRFISHAFLHGNRSHLFGNSLPLLMMGSLAILFDVYRFGLVTLLIIVLGGLGIWLFGAKNTNHIGASGLVLGYFGFTLSRGLFEANTGAFLLALFLGTVCNGFFPLIFPRDAVTSRSGHFFGFASGIFAAWFTAWLQTNYPI